ncbi:MAG: SDR family NAD(P)-dependent oxidoreductase [Acidimicrobiales bacterium]
MGEANDTIVWISGATSGIGAALARNCPYDGARIINISRRVHDEFESVVMDLTDPASWSAATTSFTEQLARFTGSRAIFIHNAFHHHRSFAGEGEPLEQFAEVMANVAAPIVLGDAFLRAARSAVERGVEVGLVQMSSGAARLPYPALAVYGAGKAAMEQWVRSVRAERDHRGVGPWVVAVRPGFVDTPAARKDALLPADDFPAAPAVADALATGIGVLDADAAARDIWAALPPTGGRSVLFFGVAIGAAGS